MGEAEHQLRGNADRGSTLGISRRLPQRRDRSICRHRFSVWSFMMLGETSPGRHMFRGAPTPAAAVRRPMTRHTALILYIVAMIAVVTIVDVAFFRNRFLERLIANIGIVLLFGAFYLRLFGRP
jgi:hypothetical protein